MRYTAPVAGYDWLDLDPSGGIDTGRRYVAPAQGIDVELPDVIEVEGIGQVAVVGFIPPFTAPGPTVLIDVDEMRATTADDIARAYDLPPEMLAGAGTYPNLAGELDSHLREVVEQGRRGGPGDPVYDFLAGNRDQLPPDWPGPAPDRPTMSDIVAEHLGPANADEQRTAIEAAGDQLATGYVIGNGPLTDAARAELVEVAMPPDWAVDPADVAYASGLPPELVRPAGATLEVMRYPVVRYAAPAILDRATGEIVSPKLAAKRQRLIDAVKLYAAADPRSQQAAIGPSEIGDPCDSRVLRKLLGFHAVASPDPWASFVGTAVHAKLTEVFAAVNASYGVDRYLIERRVWPTEHISGSTDLAELVQWSDVVGGDPGMVVDIYDHKIMGVDGFALVKKEKLAPGTKYGTQIDIYAKGWQAAGYIVRSVNLAAWKRSGFLDDLLVIEREPDYGNADLAIERLGWLRAKAVELDAVELDEPWADGRIEVSPGKGCGFCPFYSPTLPTGRGSCDRGRDFMAGAKAGKGPRGATT